MNYMKDLFSGAVIGVANIIPGVSGGTMALVLGIYERLIAAIHNISGETIKALFGLFRFNRQGLENFREELKRIDAWFLLRITAGAFAAIVALAKVMTFLLYNWHDPTYGFFFGLVLVSAFAPWKLMKKRGLASMLMILVAAGGLVGISQAMTGEKLIEKARVKQELALQKADSQGAAEAADETAGAVRLVHVFIMGAVAISAMILPGVSGSFLLLLLGGYFYILQAIATRDVPILLVFALGCLVGIVLFSRLLEYLLTKWHDQTMGFLLGLVLGSLWMIWPFKHTAVVGDEVIYLANKIPAAFGTLELITFGSFIAGAVIVLILFVIEARTGAAERA